MATATATATSTSVTTSATTNSFASWNRKRKFVLFALLFFLIGFELDHVLNTISNTATTSSTSGSSGSTSGNGNNGIIVAEKKKSNVLQQQQQQLQHNNNNPTMEYLRQMTTPLVLPYPDTIQVNGDTGIMTYTSRGTQCLRGVCFEEKENHENDGDDDDDSNSNNKWCRIVPFLSFVVPSCRRQLLRPSVNRKRTATQIIEGDVLVLPWTSHYFHFVYETVLHIESLRVYLTTKQRRPSTPPSSLSSSLFLSLDNYDVNKTTVLLFNYPHIEPQNVEMLRVLQLDSYVPSLQNDHDENRNNSAVAVMQGKKDRVYQATGRFIIPAFNNYHPKTQPHRAYNKYLMNTLRQYSIIPKYHAIGDDTTTDNAATTVSSSNSTPSSSNQQQQQQQEPKLGLFISRKGYRRGIRQEDVFYETLQRQLTAAATTTTGSGNISHPPPPDIRLQRILPDDYSVQEQANLFARAAFIVSPHGAALTNLIFSNWNTTILVEITPYQRQGNYRSDVDMKYHYVFTCPIEYPNDTSVDVWEKQMNCSSSSNSSNGQHIGSESRGSNNNDNNDDVDLQVDSISSQLVSDIVETWKLQHNVPSQNYVQTIRHFNIYNNDDDE